MDDEIKLDLNKDIIMQIEMASYAEYNDTLATMNDHLGEIYSYSDINNIEQAQLHYEKELAYRAIKELQQENERLKEENKYIFANVNDDELLISNAMNYAEAQDYKSRCEKAIEYIKEHYPTSTINDQDDKYNLLNILQNGSDKDDK